VLDNYPEKDEANDYCCGREYSSNNPVSWQGGSYYFKMIAEF